jgi:hypothetical protein
MARVGCPILGPPFPKSAIFLSLIFLSDPYLDFVHSEIGARADLRMDKVTFNC